MKLSFLIAGFQKSATSALHHYFRQHPDLYLPEKKELHFFDNEKIDWSDPSYEEAYHSYFHGAPAGTLCGEATPIYTYWKPSAGRIHSYNPSIKLIVLLRDPVARAYSHWRMEYLRNAETLPFSEAIREGRRRVAEEVEIPGLHRVYSYVERGFYADQIRRVLDLFPTDQTLFLPTSYLRLAHREVLDKACDFLGIPHYCNYPECREVFSHRRADVPPLSRADVAYLWDIYIEDIDETETITGIKIGRET